MHHLLERQLKRYGGDVTAAPAEWRPFVTAIDEAYHSGDHDRHRVERSLELMSRELNEQHERLKSDIQHRIHAEEALRETEAKLRQEIADRERMEVELRLKQKLESVGQLAAGIAHEINTPVQYVGDSMHFLKTAFGDYQRLITGYRGRIATLEGSAGVSGLRADLAALEEEIDLAYLDEQVPRAFDRVFDGTERVSAIVRAVKDFAHPDQRDKAPADLNQALQSTLIVARNEYKYVATVTTEFEPLPAIECLLGDLNQVFLNLIVNAAHAIADRFGDHLDQPAGRIRVATAADGDDVVVTVSDNGCGIPRAIRDRVFDPFFTTKAVGRGTGQGLAIARTTVVEKHGGTLSFDSAEGAGTTFVVRLPIRQRKPPEEIAA